MKLITKGKFLFFVVLIAVFTIVGFRNTSTSIPTISYKIDPHKTYQLIENFGASDAWSCQFVGQWPSVKKEKMASLLFSKELKNNGDPEGIGLSLWRFNVGAGSSRMGSESGINDEWRRAESFLQDDLSYNWNKQKGQVWFAKKAKELGVEKILIFANSPPVSFTKNNKAFSDSGSASNLDSLKFQDYANFLATTAANLSAMGIPIDYISPINEPQWDWADGGQEGTPFWNTEIAQLAKALDRELSFQDLTAKIDIAEAAQLNYLSREDNRPGRGKHIFDFYDQNSENYIGDLKHLSRTVSGHSYFTTSPLEILVAERESLAVSLNQFDNLKFWMSEYCILGDNAGEINGSGRDLGIEPALYMAKVIHHDLSIANASAWHWWLAISPYDYKDGLIYIDPEKEDGNFYESKMLWTLGNYSRFIKPGSTRIDITTNNDNSLFTSAYINKEKDQIVMVTVNNNESDRHIEIEMDQSKLRNTTSYITSKEYDLKYFSNRSSEILIPKKSIVTSIYNIKN